MIQLKLTDRKTIADQTMEFIFKKPAGFSFLAGQHLHWTLENPPETDAEGDTRELTISAAPSENHLAFTTRMRDTAFKRVIKNLPFGSTLTVTPPGGKMILPPDTAKPVIFLAGGIGITPFRSMSLQAAHDQTGHEIFLFYSNHSSKDSAYLDELTNLSKTYPRFHLIPIMTQADPADNWTGETSHVDAAIIKKYVPQAEQASYFLAGPPAFTAAMHTVLSELFVPPEATKEESFSGY